MKDEQELKAFLDEDLIDILSKIDQLEALLEGRLNCRECGDQIDEKNLMAIIPVSGNYEFTCDKPICIKNIQIATSLDK